MTDTDKITKPQGRLKTTLAIKLALWLAVTLALSLIFMRHFWLGLPAMLSPSWVLGQHHASPWAVLALCLVFLWLKRQGTWQRMLANGGFRVGNSRRVLLFYSLRVLLGIVIVAAAILMPTSSDYWVFQLILLSLGLFTILFGRAAQIPSTLLAIYGFAVSFPLLITRYAEYAYSRATIAPLIWLLSALGYPLQNQQQLVQFTCVTGEPIRVAITSACAGPATMGVFIALFALMTLDIPLPPKKAAALFLFGVAGTWVQSFIRLIILLLVGYYLGEDALWTAHFWTIYVIFPLWYVIFAVIYFWQARRPAEASSQQRVAG
ncbi:MAG: exosortase/archaeosortase family protein [Chloroflexota bacterium]